MAMLRPKLETFEFKRKPGVKGKARRWFGWHLRAKNGQIQFTAGESFTRLDSARRAALRAQLNMALTTGTTVKHYTAKGRR